MHAGSGAEGTKPDEESPHQSAGGRRIVNITRMSIARLKRLLAQAQKTLEAKQAVAARHEPGTAYHTRATKEAETYQNRITAIEAELQHRQQSADWPPQPLASSRGNRRPKGRKSFPHPEALFLRLDSGLGERY